MKTNKDDIEETDNIDMTKDYSHILVEDTAELERRRVAYAELKKKDKIFNNSYTMGTGEGEEDYFQPADIKVDISATGFHVYDRNLYIDHLDNTITELDISNFIIQNHEIRKILDLQVIDETNTINPSASTVRVKLDAVNVNKIFTLIMDGVSTGVNKSVFVNPIHVLDAISSFTGIDYKKLFDRLNYDNKELLILELDKHYNFLDKSSTNFKMY